MKLALLSIALLLLFNTAIAGLLTVIEFGEGFWINLVFSHSIGACIALINTPLLLRLAPGWQRGLALLAGLPLSVMSGIVLAHGLMGWQLMLTPLLWQSFAIGLMFAVIGSVVFLLGERVHRLDDEIRQRHITEEARARRETEAHLKLLQAQIEPHFLFNTLANVTSLIERDPARARRLLDRLNRWLRIALARTRSDQSSLGDELTLLENWLEILAERFGSRLNWHFEVAEPLLRLPFPPMLLQPLLENAIQHGIEPKVGGGKVSVIARLEDDSLQIKVSDNGIGLHEHPSAASQGTGLANVRARLHALFGNAGHLSLCANPDGGVTATLHLPCAR